MLKLIQHDKCVSFVEQFWYADVALDEVRMLYSGFLTKQSGGSLPVQAGIFTGCLDLCIPCQESSLDALGNTTWYCHSERV